MFTLQTPPRRPQFSTPKVEFETPPPPRGMPALPGPPSSDEEDDMHANHPSPGDLTTLKTPRPPGAWLATPAPSRQSSKEPAQAIGDGSSDSGLATPPSTLSRNSTLSAQTPAPPGGWIATPAPPGTKSRRGSLLRVRFDIESETASEGVHEHSSELAATNGPAVANGSSGNASASAVTVESSVEVPPTPPSMRDRIQKKHAAPPIRVLDAYGREETPVEAPPAPPVQPNAEPFPTLEQQSPPKSPSRKSSRTLLNGTPRNRSAVRMLDAMGRPVEDPTPPQVLSDDSSLLSLDPPSSRHEALARMNDTVSSMRADIRDADRSSDGAVFDERMSAALQEQCDAAARNRDKVMHKLALAQQAEAEALKDRTRWSPFKKVGNGAAALLLLIDFPSGPARDWRYLVGFAIVQILLFALMVRYAHVQARKLFLTTYYDTFNPDLYVHLETHDTTSSLIPTCPPWSILTALGNLYHHGPLEALADTWTSATCTASALVRSVFGGTTGPAYAWPPT
ncbi:uncharacterized protein BXZ73DRAFT_88725 [Epithele typhae]|uniref:uncharacterized protein n=1 Tax=Epithele typhae TaxID=378194 RepID=UPI002008626B|nr:uncharacterized protein BXZ73DRAFT_88725 [Epithele typhae]KAH9940498.1 hypothetical protein BXZ73DRAFT_88725 [Epithele typhae]